MPWLRDVNPDIDWQQRTIAERKGAHVLMSDREPLDHRNKNENDSLKVMTVSTGILDDRMKQASRGGYNGTTPRHLQESEAIADNDYEKKRREVERILPKETRDFADVFCKKE
jgi:hypothetical protein